MWHLWGSFYEAKLIMYRSSHLEVFCKKGVLRNFTKFTRKHFCWSVCFNEIASLHSIALLKNTLKAQVFLRARFSYSTSGQVVTSNYWLVTSNLWLAKSFTSLQRCIQDVFKTSSRFISSQTVLVNTSFRRLQVVFKMYSTRFWDVLWKLLST